MAILAFQNRKFSPMLQRFAFLAILCLPFLQLNAQTSELSVEKIMQDPQWMGNFPDRVRWGIHSENVYFQYNPEGNAADSLYKITIDDPQKILKVSSEESKAMIDEAIGPLFYRVRKSELNLGPQNFHDPIMIDMKENEKKLQGK